MQKVTPQVRAARGAEKTAIKAYQADPTDPRLATAVAAGKAVRDAKQASR